MRKAFTLIEVMVAVIIISIVIASLLQLFSNNTRFFNKLGQKIDLSMQATLLFDNGTVGFEKEGLMLDELLKDFNPDDELRRKLKEMKAKVDYHTVMRLDEGSLSDEDKTAAGVDTADQSAAATTLEIPRENLYVKRRRRLHGPDRYQQLNEQQVTKTVALADGTRHRACLVRDF